MHIALKVLISSKWKKLAQQSLELLALELCWALPLLSATNRPVYRGPPATADSANAAIWAGTESTDRLLTGFAASDARLTDFGPVYVRVCV